MPDQLTELARDLRERSLTYTFLARALSDDEVGAEFLAALRDDVPQTGTDLDVFARSLQDVDDETLEQVRRELAADHSATLLGMSALPVSPFESAWSDAHLLMQDARDDAVKAYARAGFGKSEDYHMPEDHISLELDFMAGLGNRAAAAVEAVLAGDAGEPATGETGALESAEEAMNAQLDFLEKHLLTWAPQFADKLEERASTGFYRGVAQMLRLYLEDERAYLEQLEGAQG